MTTRTRLESVQSRGRDVFARLEQAQPDHASIDVGFRWLVRDKEIAGGVLGGGLAYRFFFWVLALSLLSAGGLGFAAHSESDADIEATAADVGLGDSVQSTVATAAAQSESGRWWLIVLGVFFTLWFSFGLLRALRLVHSAAWRVPPQPLRNAPRVIAFVALSPLVFAAFVGGAGWVRSHAGFFPGLLATLSLCVAFGLVWLWVSMHLPAPDVPWTAFVPGAVVFAVGLEALHLFTAYYLAESLASRSELYGALGLAGTLLFYLFLVGRGVVWSAELNAVVWELRSGARDRGG
jgi:uncharacterized BrkB/YihY/UPF0761 family membrane protein